MDEKRTRHLPLDHEGCRILADALGDTPLTVISVHQLRRGLCRAYVAGDPTHFAGAIVQGHSAPDEPAAYGADPDVLWDLLQAVSGWRCVDVPTACAAALGERISAATGRPVRYYGDLYHALRRPVTPYAHPAVRLLAPADLPLLEAAPPELRASAFESPASLLRAGFVACAIAGGRIVATALTSARSALHADIGVYTLPEWRGQGLVTAAASLVARRVQEAGQTPVWSTGEDNQASRRVAYKLGFVEVGRTTYLVLHTDSNRHDSLHAAPGWLLRPA